MRAYPKGLRVSSSNLDPAIFWRQGVQMGRSHHPRDRPPLSVTCGVNVSQCFYRIH